MSSELFNSFGAAQNPREQALGLLKQRGLRVPDGISNNPQAIIQHLMQTGQVPGNRLQMAQQILSRLAGR